jgi:hypothetical protein
LSAGFSGIIGKQLSEGIQQGAGVVLLDGGPFGGWPFSGGGGRLLEGGRNEIEAVPGEKLAGEGQREAQLHGAERHRLRHR